MNETALYRDLSVIAAKSTVPPAAADVTAYAHLVADNVWSDAIAASLAAHGAAVVPALPAPIYLDRPIVLAAGNCLHVHPDTELRLRPNPAGPTMVRNANVLPAPDAPVPADARPDTGIRIEGGIWSNQDAGEPGAGEFPGGRAAFLLHNVADLAVRNVRFRDCCSFAIQLGNATDFLVDNVQVHNTCDGVHVEGPASRGVIRGVHGKTNDDVVALNAWDWQGSSVTFGPITDILVEDVESVPGYTWSEIRLLPGTKVFPDGTRLACDIRRCIFRDIRHVHSFKMYDQPNIHMPDADCANPIGRMADLFFADLVIDGIPLADYYDKSADAVFDIGAHVDGISIRDVRLTYRPGEGDLPPYLVAVGPKALTWPRGDGWLEVFNPHANPVVRGLAIADVAILGVPVPAAGVAALVHERVLTPNPDFPRTLPRGGTGRGRVEFR